MKPFSQWIFVCFSLTFVLLAACSEQPLPSQPTFVVPQPSPPLLIGLSDSAYAFEPLARLAYEHDPGQAKLHFIVGNDQTLLADLDAGRLDAFLGYYAPESEDHWIDPVALDSLVFFTHPVIPLNNAGLQELKAVFAGAVTNWSIFGLAEIPIVLYIRESGAGADTIFNSQVMTGAPVDPLSLITINEMDMMHSVTNTPGAIGYGMMGSLEGPSVLSIDGKHASIETTTNQTYPLISPVYFVSKEEPSGDLRIFLSNLHSDTGQSFIGEKFGRLR